MTSQKPFVQTVRQYLPETTSTSVASELYGWYRYCVTDVLLLLVLLFVLLD